jgi:hypothetical protein
MRGPSDPQARTVRTADRPASRPDRPAAQYGAQHLVLGGERWLRGSDEKGGDHIAPGHGEFATTPPYPRICAERRETRHWLRRLGLEVGDVV